MAEKPHIVVLSVKSGQIGLECLHKQQNSSKLAQPEKKEQILFAILNCLFCNHKWWSQGHLCNCQPIIIFPVHAFPFPPTLS